MNTTNKGTKMKQEPKRVLLRCQLAGTHYGTVVSDKNGRLVLRNACKVWSWTGARTHHEMSIAGPGKGSRVTVRSYEMSVALADVVECHLVTAPDSAFEAQWT